MAEDLSLETKYELYKTKKGMVLLVSDIRIGIMKELSKGRMTLADLSRHMKISQSTLATNLTKMTDNCLITTEPDQIDNRKIYYLIDSVLTIRSFDGDPEAKEKSDLSLENAAVNPDDFFRSLMVSMSLRAESIGIDLGPAFGRAGMDFAIKLYPKVRADTVENLIVNVKDYISEAKLGELNVFTFVPLTLTLQNNSEYLTTSARLFSDFLFGFFKSILQLHTGREYTITNYESFGNGIIKFTIDVLPKA